MPFGLGLVFVSRGNALLLPFSPAVFGVRRLPRHQQPFLRPLMDQEKQRAARARKQRMLEMEVEAKRKALKSDIEVSSCITEKRVIQIFPTFVR